MALRRRLGRLADTLLRSNLQHQEATYQDELIRGRQEQLSKQGADQQLLQRLLTDPKALEQYLKSGQSILAGVNLRPLAATRGDASATVAAGIAKTDSLDKMQTPADIVATYNDQPGASNAAPGGINTPGPDGLAPTPKPTAIENLLAQAQAKRLSLKNAAPPIVRASRGPNGAAQSEIVNPYDAVGQGPVQTERTAEQEGSRQATILGAETPGKVKLAGAEAGAREAASFPWQLKLATARADASLLNAKALDDYKRAHPHATSIELNRERAAQTALGMITENRAMLDEMEKQGLLGPLTGRGAELAAGKIKSEDVFASPDQAKLAADYFSSMRLLRSLATVAHGGSKGGGSPMMDHIFESIISAAGDKANTSGQLDALQRLMQKYADNPAAPVEPDMNIPGLPGPRDPRQPLAIDPSIQELINRGKR